MLKLMKYEFLRKIKKLGIALVILAILEGVSLYTIYKGGSSLGYTFALMMLMITGTFIFLLISSITMYSSDLNKKSGYMLFLTPNSSAKIIGSKLLVSLIEAGVSLLLLFGSIYYNYKIIFDKYLNSPQAQELIEFFKDLVGQATLQNIGFAVISFILAWFSLITVIYLAITIRKTILSNIKAGGLISFIIFLIIQWIVSYGDRFFVGSSNITSEMALNSSIPSIIYYCVVMVVVYTASSLILSKGVDL